MTTSVVDVAEGLKASLSALLTSLSWGILREAMYTLAPFCTRLVAIISPNPDPPPLHVGDLGQYAMQGGCQWSANSRNKCDLATDVEQARRLKLHGHVDVEEL